MLTHEVLAELNGGAALLALVLYAILAGADFGGGVWDFFARGPRTGEQRAAIARALGPVWEANHVWLVFLIVLLFSCFPQAFRTLSIALFVPFHLVLLGIVLRGAAFVFQAYGRAAIGVPLSWGHVFGAASVFTPLLLGACLGAISNGQIRVADGEVLPGSTLAWLDPFALMTGVLALVLCAYLAAVYLTTETIGELREDFRRRALRIWLLAGILSFATLLLTYVEAPRLWEGLTSVRAAPIVLAGALLAPASALALLLRRFVLARVLAAGQVALLLIGWALAQWPYLIYPDHTLIESAAPSATLAFILWTLPPGLALLVPSLILLFVVFKGQNPAVSAGNEH